MHGINYGRPNLDISMEYSAPQFKEIFPEAQQQIVFDNAWSLGLRVRSFLLLMGDR